MAKIQVVVPDIGGAEGAEVIELLVAEGDTVELEQGLIVLESDKASMEIPSTVAGVVVSLLVTEGQELSEGEPILVIEAEGAAAEAAPEEPAPTEPSPEPAQEVPAQASAPEPATTSAAAAVEYPVAVPDIGTDEAVELIEISVAVGDTVAEGDSLVVLESDKASMEVPAPVAGEVVSISAQVGDAVKQGDALMVCLVADGQSAAPLVAAEPPAQAAAAAAAPQPAPAAPLKSAPQASSAGGAHAGPAVRKLAREFGIDLGKVSGSGPRGRIVKEDLHQYVQRSLSGAGAAPAAGAGIPPVPEVDFAAFGPVESVARSKLDKVTAANMQRNWLNVPHVTQFDDADITELEAFRKSLKAEAEQRGTKLTPMPFLIKAVAAALRGHPKFCASLSADGEQLVYKQYVHVGMAVDTPAGLVVPVIRDADTKSVWALAEEVAAMAAKARDRKLTPDDMRGGCFTVSSLGNIGGRGFTPIVNAPEVGILGVSRASVQPVWDGSSFEPRTMLPLGLSYDHRVINGGDAGRFLTDLVAMLGDIRRLVL